MGTDCQAVLNALPWVREVTHAVRHSPSRFSFGPLVPKR
jgi:hypothetical protein